MLQFPSMYKISSKQKLVDKLKMMPKDSAQQQTKHLIEVVKPLRLIEDSNNKELKPQEAAVEILTSMANLYKNHTDFYHAIELGVELSPQKEEEDSDDDEKESVATLEKYKSALKNKIENAKATDQSYFEAKQRVEKEDIQEDIDNQYFEWLQYKSDLSTYEAKSGETDTTTKKAPKTEKGTRSQPPQQPVGMSYDFENKSKEEILDSAFRKCDVKYDRLFIKARDVLMEYNSELSELEDKILELTRTDKTTFIEQIYFAGYASAETLLIIKIKDIVNYPTLIEMKQKLEQSQDNKGINQCPLESNSLKVLLAALKDAYAKPSFSTFHALKQKMHHDSLKMRMSYATTSKVSDYDKVITSTSKDLLIMDNLRVFEMYNSKDYEFVFTLLLRLNPNDPLRQDIIEAIVKSEREAEEQAEKSSATSMSTLTEHNLSKLEARSAAEIESSVSHAGSRKPDNKMNLFYLAKRMIQEKRDLHREVNQIDEAKSSNLKETDIKDESETDAYNAEKEKTDESRKKLQCFRNWKKFTKDKEGNEIIYTSTHSRCSKCSEEDNDKWCDKDKPCKLMKCYNCNMYGHHSTNCFSKVRASPGYVPKRRGGGGQSTKK